MTPENDSIERRLERLGCVLPEPTATAYGYHPALRYKNTIHVAGQIPKLSVDKLVAYGRLGLDVGDDEARQATRLCMLHALAWVRQLAGDLERIDQVLRVNYFFQVREGTAVPMSDIADAGSALLVDLLGERGRHPRSVIGVSTLPRNAPVLVDMDIALRE